MTLLRRFAIGLVWLMGAYFVVRAIAEPFVIDFSDPSTYRTDWGGPSLIGVLAVHMLPGLLAAALMVLALTKGIGGGRPLSREFTLHGPGHHRAEDLIVKESDRDEVEVTATTVELDGRYDVQEPTFGVGPDPGGEMEVGVVGVNQCLAMDDPVDGEHRSRVGSSDADQPDQGLAKPEESLHPRRGRVGNENAAGPPPRIVIAGGSHRDRCRGCPVNAIEQ